VINESNDRILSNIYEALRHKAHAVRKAAIQVLPHSEDTFNAMQDAGILQDPNGATQLAAINKLWSIPSSDKLSDMLVSLAKNSGISEDLWLKRATYLSSVKHNSGFLAALKRDNPNVIEEESTTAEQNQAHPGVTIHLSMELKWVKEKGGILSATTRYLQEY